LSKFCSLKPNPKFDKILFKHLLFAWLVTAVTKDYGDVCGLSEQRNNQSGFSFELQELSTKLAEIEVGKKKVNPEA
jgi:hypothetical protein